MDGQSSVIQHIADTDSCLAGFGSVDDLTTGAVLVHNGPFVGVNEFIALRDKICIFIGYPCFTARAIYFTNLSVDGPERIRNPADIWFVTAIAVKLINGSFHKITPY